MTPLIFSKKKRGNTHITAWLPPRHTGRHIIIHKHPPRGRHYSLWRNPQPTYNARSLHSRPLPHNRDHLDKKYILFQWRCLSTEIWHSNGNENGPLLCKPIPGSSRTQNSVTQTTSMVKIHWWHIRYLDTRQTTFRKLHIKHQQSPQHNKVHSYFLRRSHLLRHKGIHQRRSPQDGPPCEGHWHQSIPSCHNCHPLHCKTAISFSQALRLKQICSSNENFEKRTQELVENLSARGYYIKALEEDVQRASSINRKECLQPRPKSKIDRIPLVITYNPSLPSIVHIAREHHHNLHTSERMKWATPEPPLIAFRRPKNLRDLLVRAELRQNQRSPPGNKKCGNPKCKTCSILITESTFSSHSNGKSFTLKSTATCKTTNVIYMIHCKCCGKQYVGETGQTLHQIMNGHRTDVTHNTPDKPVADHFNGTGHSADDISIMVIERLWRNDTVLRKTKESKWIRTLSTAYPNGMNLRTDSLWPLYLLTSHILTFTHYLHSNPSYSSTYLNPPSIPFTRSHMKKATAKTLCAICQLLWISAE